MTGVDTLLMGKDDEYHQLCFLLALETCLSLHSLSRLVALGAHSLLINIDR